MGDFFSGGSRSGVAGGLPGGVKLAAVALLLHQLMKHARAGQAQATPGEGVPPTTTTAATPGGGLGDLLGGLLGGGGAGAGAGGTRTAATGGGGGLGDLLGGLLGGGGGGGRAAAQGGGGLGGLLGAGAAGGLLSGLGGLLRNLHNQEGLGPKVDSWVRPGPNQPVSPQELEPAFDPEELDQAAQRAGTDRGAVLDELSRMLPQAVDRMTPQGHLPQREEEMGGGGLGGLLGSLLGGNAGAAPRRGPQR
jgi:uncharacterized protein YidB (DUF937 family)